jgi:hypothetical protein
MQRLCNLKQGRMLPCFFRHSALDAESPENTQRLRVKPAMTVQIRDLSTVETLHATSLQRETRGLAPLSSREIQFVATGTSEAGFEFYSWDFNYSPPLEVPATSPCPSKRGE